MDVVFVCMKMLKCVVVCTRPLKKMFYTGVSHQLCKYRIMGDLRSLGIWNVVIYTLV